MPTREEGRSLPLRKPLPCGMAALSPSAQLGLSQEEALLHMVQGSGRAQPGQMRAPMPSGSARCV
eukprot:360642-Chlamydomonas_euryale.AAC.2